jgi:heat shock protein HslJ
VLDQRASALGVVSTSVVVTARFAADGRLSGNGGCNQYRTSYTAVRTSLTIDGPISSSLMSCGSAVDRVEQAYLARLPRAEAYAIDGSVLTIDTRGRAGPLVYDALDPDELFAGDWTVVSYFRPGAVVSPVVGSTLTATFDADRISGESGCNSFSGRFEVDGGDIAIGPLASTLRACADPAVDEQERQYLAALELARTYSFDGANLTVLREDGGIAVTLQRA